MRLVNRSVRLPLWFPLRRRTPIWPKGSRNNNLPFSHPIFGPSSTDPQSRKLDVAVLRLRFRSIGSVESDPNLGAKTASYCCASPKGPSSFARPRSWVFALLLGAVEDCVDGANALADTGPVKDPLRLPVVACQGAIGILTGRDL